jgi:acyl-coenzyme A thioesterase PaaI-like protein
VSLIASLKRAVLAQARGPQIARLLNFYPPFLGAGVRVRQLGPCAFESSMALRAWNRNYFGTHFGGSLFSMCDPFFALILAQNLGPDYLVWDKSATIRFKKPGKGLVSALFEIAPERIEEIRRGVAERRKLEPVFVAEVRDQQGELIAEVEKLLYVRRATR